LGSEDVAFWEAKPVALSREGTVKVVGAAGGAVDAASIALSTAAPVTVDSNWLLI